MRITTSSLAFGSVSLALLLTNAPLFIVSTDLQQPGTQPQQAPLLGALQNCDGCHGYYNQAVEPVENWMGSMMAQAGRDPVFWAAMAVAEGDIPALMKAWDLFASLSSNASILRSLTKPLLAPAVSRPLCCRRSYCPRSFALLE